MLLQTGLFSYITIVIVGDVPQLTFKLSIMAIVVICILTMALWTTIGENEATN